MSHAARVAAARAAVVRRTPGLPRGPVDELSEASLSLTAPATLAKLAKRMKALSRAEAKLARVAALPYLSEGHSEVKWPARDEQIVVDKKVWTEPAPNGGINKKTGLPRVVVRVQRRVSVVKVERREGKKPKAVRSITNQHHAV